MQRVGTSLVIRRRAARCILGCWDVPGTFVNHRVSLTEARHPREQSLPKEPAALWRGLLSRSEHTQIFDVPPVPKDPRSGRRIIDWDSRPQYLGRFRWCRALCITVSFFVCFSALTMRHEYVLVPWQKVLVGHVLTVFKLQTSATLHACAFEISWLHFIRWPT